MYGGLSPLEKAFRAIKGIIKGIWEDKGVAFIKSERNEAVESLGRMYLVKKDQFIEIVRQESGKEPDEILQPEEQLPKFVL